MKKETFLPRNGDLRVWWIPQIPGKPFLVPVKSPKEGLKVLNILGEYDQFQLDNNIKPDYCNAGGLSMFDSKDDHDGPNGSWSDWYDDDGNDIESFELVDGEFNLIK